MGKTRPLGSKGVHRTKENLRWGKTEFLQQGGANTGSQGIRENRIQKEREKSANARRGGPESCSCKVEGNWKHTTKGRPEGPSENSGSGTILKTPNFRRQGKRRKLDLANGERPSTNKKDSRTTRKVARTRRAQRRHYRGPKGAGCKGVRQMGLHRDSMYRKPRGNTTSTLQEWVRPICRTKLHPQGGKQKADKKATGDEEGHEERR